MNQDRPEIKPLDDDFQFTSNSRDAYKPVAVKKLFKGNISDVQQTEQIDNFKTKPDGKPNPNYGKPQTMFVVSFKLNDDAAGEGNGQVYTKWVSTAVSDRSGLGKISDAVFGGPTAILEHKKGDLVGQPLKFALQQGKKDPERLVVDIDKLMPADEDQERIVQDVVVSELPEGGMTEEELDAVFPS